MRPRVWWRELKERNERETDERVHSISLLVVRDGFIAVMLLIGALVFFQPIFGEQSAAEIMAFFPVIAMFVAGSVITISTALRGGFGFSRGTAAYRSIFVVLGALFGVGIVILLSLFGIGPPLSEAWWSLVSIMAGFSVGAAVMILVSGRGR